LVSIRIEKKNYFFLKTSGGVFEISQKRAIQVIQYIRKMLSK
jgi:hypothetical protein